MKDLNEVINKIINKAVVGCDKYVHNDSTWLIFTDDKKWVIELTKDGTLWYNYDFFKNLFKVLSLDVVENQNYITKWVEETIINGVRNTIQSITQQRRIVEDTIKNGVKHTEYGDWLDGDERFDDIIQNGVKHTVASDCLPSVFVEDTIQNGMKHTEKSLQIDGSCVVEDVIQNGIKETHDDVYHHKGRVGGVIKNGIKETKLIDYSDNTEFIVNGVISRGISI
jgi:predicted transcriptional regulator